MSSTDSAEPPGQFAAGSRFLALSFLGRGSSGVVYRVADRETGAELALKTLGTFDANKMYELKQEYRALAGIRHRNLVELYELVVNAHECFFTMELVDGPTFTEWVNAVPAGPERLTRFAGAARQVVHGLSALHAAGKLHRDVKPSNILVDPSGRVVLLDFGLAVALGGGREDAAGTLAYMAPEVLTATSAGTAADWYGAGVTFYEALAGRLPFDGDLQRMFRQKLEVRPEPLTDCGVPDAPARTLEALTAPDPARRPGADEILLALDELAPAAEPEHPPLVLGDTPFVGRAAEIAELQRALAAVASGRPVLAHVVGPSGIGKSELVRRFASSAEEHGEALFLRGRCHPHEAVPYNAFDGLVDSLTRALLALPRAEAEAVVPADAAALVRLFPVLERVDPFRTRSDALEVAEPQEIRRRGFAAVRQMLALLARAHRLVLWIDDAQWADEDSVALAREILRPPDSPALLLLLSYRAEERDKVVLGRSATLADGSPLECRIVELAPLALEESEALAALLSGGHRLDLAAVAREANGSPFFVGQLVRHLAAAGGGSRPPRGLAGVLEARLRRLPPVARSLLEVVAVAGQPLDRALALAAAGTDARERTAVINLEEDRLLRSTQKEGRLLVEVYHDRIRETLLGELAPATRRDRHRDLAAVLQVQADPDPQALYRHFLGAGEQEPAARWAVAAAEKADRALAFVEAAAMYGRALELVPEDGGRRAELLEKRAAALVNAGHGAEAAPLFLAAADAGGDRAAELRRHAAEQFLVTGHINEGTAILRRLLESVGLRYPASTPRAALGTLARLAVLRLRGAERPPRRAGGALDDMRLEAAHSAAKGLAMIDPFRGLYFAVTSLSLAARASDPVVRARAMAGVGAALLPAGPPFANWAMQLLQRACELAESTADPYLLGFTSITLAQQRMVEGRWRDMLALCDRGCDLLRRHCRGVWWELGIGGVAAQRALEELGEVDELQQRCARTLAVAEESNDAYGIVVGLGNTALAYLLGGDVDRARDYNRRTRERKLSSAFDMQHFYILRLDAYCDLAEGRGDAALEAMRRRWPELEKSNLLRHTLLRTDAHLLRARLALAAAQRAGEASLLAEVEKAARLLELQARRDTVGHAAMLRAGCAALRGDREAAADLLERAEQQYAAAEMSLCLALSRLRRQGLAPRANGDAQIGSGCRIENPAPLLAMFAPGFGS